MTGQLRNQILLGIDLGTTVLKLCAFDGRSGAILGQAARRLPVALSPNGGREQSLASVDRAFRAIVGELKRQVGTAWRQIEGVGLAAQGGSSIIVNRADGKPLTSMILWNDGRTHAYTARVAERAPKRIWRDKLLCDAPPAGLGRLLWLKETRPELFQAENLHVGAGEYLFFRLTGVWRQDAGNAVQIGSYNAAAQKLDSAFFRLIDLPLSFVAPLRKGHETAPLSKPGARLLGLAEGIPVAGPYIDQETGYLSTVGVCERPLQCSLGTAWVGNFILPGKTNGFSPTQIVLPSPVGKGRLVIQPLLTGNTVWDWGLAHLLDAKRERALALAEKVFAESLTPPDGLVALPWFAQPSPLFPQAHGGGLFFGLHAQTDRADQLRALAAGMVCEFARVFTEVKSSEAVDGVVLGGGASKGSYFRRWLAALFSPLPVFWQIDEDLSAARGAVFAFSPKAARGRVRRVEKISAALLSAIQNHYDQYRRVFEKFYSSIPVGQAFSFAGRKK